MTGGPRVTVVVATKNRLARLEKLLASLRAQTIGTEAFELVVVDDGSTDATPAHLRAAERRGDLALTVLRNESSQGATIARDAGWRAGSAPIVAFTDDDCVAESTWLEAGLAACAEHPGAVVQGSTEPDPHEDHLRSPFSRTQLIVSMSGRFETCNIFFPRKVLEAIDGFDPRIPDHGGEDTDLAWRAHEDGAPLVFDAAPRVFHAVEVVGPIGVLRYAYRWHKAVAVFGLHPRLRREQLHHRVFWSATHEHFFLFLLAMGLWRWARPLSILLSLPYVRRLVWRRSGPLLAPFLFLHDAVEVAGILRGAVRERVLVV